MGKILDITINPDPRLRLESAKIDLKIVTEPAFKSLVKDMILTMHKKDGVGLAAPQIGQNIRMMIVNTDSGPIAMINPVILKKSWAKVWAEEGCLSVPNVFGEVSRHKKVVCEYFDDKGQKKKLDASEMTARVIQHELDHLDGILFIDKAKKLVTLKPDEKPAITD